jgi:hypothetical protein
MDREQDAIDQKNIADAKVEEKDRLQSEAESASLAEVTEAESAARKDWYEKVAAQRRLKRESKRESESLGGGVPDEGRRDGDRRDGSQSDGDGGQ